MYQHVDIKILGNVQGVSFRYFAHQKARELKITGFIRNEPDGSVYCEAEGDKEEIQMFIQWCSKGPKLAHVRKVEVTPSTLKHFHEFIAA